MTNKIGATESYNWKAFLTDQVKTTQILKKKKSGRISQIKIKGSQQDSNVKSLENNCFLLVDWELPSHPSKCLKKRSMRYDTLKSEFIA